MKITGFKAGVNEDDKIEWVKITRTDSEGNNTRTNIKIGSEFIVIPDNPRKLKHRDRQGVVKSFRRNERNGELKAHLRFYDNGYMGWVNVEDLKKIPKE